MDKRNSQIYILNLTGELVPELASYFSSRNITVVNPLESDVIYDWTHILTKDLHDFTLLNKTYELSSKDRHVISLSQVQDLQNFTINNGNLILDDIWLSGSMGVFILDKYFQSYGGISLSDNYPSFTEIGSFNIANPFHTGEYLDRMVQKAFESGVNALTLKTFFDHLIMYVSGLKSQGKVGLPFEVTYGVFEEIFGVQIHFYSKQLTVMDVSLGLSSYMSKRAEEYLLNVAVQSTDFFDFSYMPEVNKVMVTALWSKSERIKFENRGMMLASLVGGLPVTQYKNEGATSALVSVSPTLLSVKPSDQSHDSESVQEVLSGQNPVALNLPSIIKAPEDIQDFSEKVKIPPDLTDETAEQIVRGFEENDVNVKKVSNAQVSDERDVIKALAPTPDEQYVIKALPSTPDESTLIKGGELLDEVAQLVKGKLEKDDDIFKVAGGKLDVDKFAYRVASNVDEATQEKNLKVRSLGNVLPQSIKTGLFDFAKGLGKPIDGLSDNDLDKFQLQVVPDIIKKELMTVTSPTSRQVIGSGTRPDEETLARLKEAEMKLANANFENEKLQGQLKTLASEVRILKESRAKMAELQLKAKQSSNEIKIASDEDEDLRNQFVNKLSNQKSLDGSESIKLKELLDRENKMIKTLREEELKARKLHFEATQKEVLFAKEMEKVQRELRGKELILSKTKESLTKLIEKKDHIINELKNRIEQLNYAASSNASPHNQKIIKDIEKQNQNLLKQIEGYKNKIAALSLNSKGTKSDETLKAELRKLQTMNQQAKNQIDLAKKESEKLLSKMNLEAEALAQLRVEKIKLEDALKKAEAKARIPVAPTVIPQNDAELKRLQSQNMIFENQVKDSLQKITVLEAKIAEMSKPIKTLATDEGSKVKVNQLENSVKKLTQDLIESRNQIAESKKETNKLRQEKTALQNQIDKLKKETDKGKSATPKKPGGKVA
jgi:hypothetical protein